MESPFLTAIIQESVLILLIIGSIFALLLGLLFILSPKQANALSLRYSHWTSLRRPSKPLEVPHEADHYFYRYHRTMGLFILISASYILYRFAFDYDQTATIRAMNHIFGHENTIEWLLEAALWFILPISGLLLLFGTTIALKPSAMKGIETVANHWVSTRKALQPVDKQNKSLDKWVWLQPRLFGTLLILSASYILIILLIFFIKKIY